MMAIDRITKSLLEEFSNESGLKHLAMDKQFEHFAAYLAVSRHHAEAFDTSDVVTGSGLDTGIDGVCILINGVLINEVEMVDELAETNGYVDAIFVFVQAETSEGFQASKIGQFGFGVTDFFAEHPRLPRNDQITQATEIMAAVYERSSRFKRGNPVCKLVYMTSGKWTGDANLEVRRKAVIDDLEKLNIFREVDFLPAGSDAIQTIYNQSKNAISREFTFASRIVVPEIDNVDEAYIGVLPAKEFISLLDDGSGDILRSVFYDNVRDWQDYNKVNSEIKATLCSGDQRALFTLMNNGVTIIAKKLHPTGNKILIEDYQFVNGCQTSHVIFDNREFIDDSVLVPLRLIATENEDVKASIVKATNRQTQVKEEQLIALSDFQKKIEKYFQTFKSDKVLFYERRARQYAAVSSIEKTRVITPSNLIRAYASIFLGEAHRTTRTYRALVEQLGDSIFGPQDRLEPYYYAASALYRIEFLFRNYQLDVKYKPARFVILYAARLISMPGKPPRANSREMSRYCEPLISQIWNAVEAEKLFKEASRVVEDVAGGNLHRDHVRTQAFTERVERECGRLDRSTDGAPPT